VGEAKRRKETLGEKYGKEPNIAPWLPFTKTQADRFTKITTTGAWTGIILLVAAWLTIRFIGPTVGWWTVN
jgi:fatty acid desaturase